MKTKIALLISAISMVSTLLIAVEPSHADILPPTRDPEVASSCGDDILPPTRDPEKAKTLDSCSAHANFSIKASESSVNS
jgi:hypothetical protein